MVSLSAVGYAEALFLDRHVHLYLKSIRDLWGQVSGFSNSSWRSNQEIRYKQGIVLVDASDFGAHDHSQKWYNFRNTILQVHK